MRGAGSTDARRMSPSGRGSGTRRRLLRNPNVVVGGLAVALVAGAALLSFLWTPYDPTLVDPTSRLLHPSWEHWCGTDKFGRDVASRLLHGARTTLFVGLVSVGVAAGVGVPLGVWSAMSSGRPARWAMRFGDILLAFPALLLAIMLGAVYGGSTLTAMLAIGISGIPTFARVVRSGALQVMTTDYVLAARAAGRLPFAIARRHVLPGVAPLVIVQASVSFAMAVLAEAALSFLGFGTPPPAPSWGRMLSESQELLWSHPMLAVYPGVAIAVSVLGFNLLGDGLRDVLDPRMEERR